MILMQRCWGAACLVDHGQLAKSAACLYVLRCVSWTAGGLSRVNFWADAKPKSSALTVSEREARAQTACGLQLAPPRCATPSTASSSCLACPAQHHRRRNFNHNNLQLA